MQLHQVKVFSSTPEGGNLAGVVSDAQDLDAFEMLSISASIGATESSFITKSSNEEVSLRLFTPSREIGLCVHATIAAVAVLHEANQLEGHLLTINLADGTVQASVEEQKVFLALHPCLVDIRHPDAQSICDHLELSVEDLIAKPHTIRVLGDRELVVPVKDMATLAKLSPNQEQYGLLCSQNDLNGITLFCPESRDSRNDIHIREFAPLYGYLEDPLCGTGAVAACVYLKEILNSRKPQIRVEQGFFMGTSGMIEVSWGSQSGCMWVGGQYCSL